MRLARWLCRAHKSPAATLVRRQILPPIRRTLIVSLAFRAIRNTGLALSLGLTALAAYQGIRDAMADQPLGHGGGSRHLDASGPRDVVFCHQCDNEWYRDEHGLSCPRCQSEVTEIITPDSDPRPASDSRPPTPPGFRSLPSLHDHNPWGNGDDDSDPEEADIEEHITRGPGGSMLFSRTIRTTSTPWGAYGGRRLRDPMPRDDPDNVMRDFQTMIGNLMGPGFRAGPPGRSGPDTLFTQGPHVSGFRLGGNGGPQIVGGRFTFTTTGGRLRPRDINGPQPGGPPIDDLATIIGSLLGPVGPSGHLHDGPPGLPPSFQALFSAMLNPANARSGDAVYSQEALDQIISTLMEQHPTSNAPGPASPDAIAALPKKKLDEKLLGPEGKGECSVCMDDVHTGDEVVVLPCSHWFHETCAGAWLSEHNTCPICRKGIENEPAPSGSRRVSQSTPTSRNEHRSRRSSSTRVPLRRGDTGESSRNQARLDAIQDRGIVMPPEEPPAWSTSRDRHRREEADDYASSMPGSFSNSYRRPSEIGENQRDSRRGNTSGSDRSRESRHSSYSGGGGGGSGGGPMSWLRDRFSSSRRND